MTRQIFEEKTVGRVGRFVAEALDKAIASYRQFAAGEDNKKDFAAYHKAQRVAVAHIELLLKLAFMVVESYGMEKKTGGDRIALSSMIRAAQAEVSDYRRKVRSEEDSSTE